MSADTNAGKQELFALMANGTYHRQSCSYAKNAENLVPIDKIPADAKPCGRCEPPPVGANPPADPDASTPPPADTNAGKQDGEKNLVRAKCFRACTAQGAFRNPGDVLSFEQGKVNPHFRVIEG